MDANHSTLSYDAICHNNNSLSFPRNYSRHNDNSWQVSTSKCKFPLHITDKSLWSWKFQQLLCCVKWDYLCSLWQIILFKLLLCECSAPDHNALQHWNKIVQYSWYFHEMCYFEYVYFYCVYKGVIFWEHLLLSNFHFCKNFKPQCFFTIAHVLG